MSASIPAVAADKLHDEHVSLRRYWWVLLALGLVSIVVGLLAMSAAVVATMASVVVLGVLLLIEGVSQLIRAVMVRRWRGFAPHLLAAALYLIVGLFMLEDPVRAAVVLTLLITASFFVSGVLRIVFSLVEQFHSRAWVFLAGVVDLVLAAILWRNWPEASLWVIGLFLGIELLFHGWSSVFLALAVRASSPVPTT